MKNTEKNKYLMRSQLGLPIIIFLVLGITVFLFSSASLFVQRAHERMDSLIAYLNSQGFNCSEIQSVPSFPTVTYSVDNCHGHDGLFLTKALDYPYNMIYYAKNNIGSYMWFYISEHEVVINYHTLW